MARRPTYLERLSPAPPSFQQLAAVWCADQSALILRLVWVAYDLLHGNYLDRQALSRQDDRKEETLNYLLALEIDKNKGEFAPFSVTPEVPEQTGRKGGKAQSPRPDIGLCCYDNPRVVWPLEGKILKDDADVAAYAAEVIGNFLTGRYATFSSEGAMVGYLLSGIPETGFTNIAAAIGCTLLKHKVIQDRPHRVSEHRRADLPHPNCPVDFLCHHLLMEIRTSP